MMLNILHCLRYIYYAQHFRNGLYSFVVQWLAYQHSIQRVQSQQLPQPKLKTNEKIWQHNGNQPPEDSGQYPKYYIILRKMLIL
jgi:hypothetical protein